MSKLTETLQKNIPKNLKSVSVKYNDKLLNASLIEQLGIYLSTTSAQKIIEFSFIIVATKNLDSQTSILKQINHQSAKEIIDIFSENNLRNTEQNRQCTDIPRWMILMVTRGVDLSYQSKLSTTEDVINFVLNLCLKLLEKPLGNNGKTTLY